MQSPELPFPNTVQDSFVHREHMENTNATAKESGPSSLDCSRHMTPAQVTRNIFAFHQKQKGWQRHKSHAPSQAQHKFASLEVGLVQKSWHLQGLVHPVCQDFIRTGISPRPLPKAQTIQNQWQDGGHAVHED